ncbi:MAG: hypothetical protein ACM3XM_14385 [Mycobacterium leprae]
MLIRSGNTIRMPETGIPHMLDIEHVYKGEVGSSLTVYQRWIVGAPSLQVGDRWLLFLHRDQFGNLTAGPCTPSAKLEPGTEPAPEVLGATLTLATPVSTEQIGTYIHATARADLSGHTEVVIHKAYAGQSGPIRDIIGMQVPAPDGFPKVEIATSGAVKATRENGRIVVESTGPGLGEIDLFVTYNRLVSTIWLQVPEASGVGTIRLNAVTEFGDGMHAARQGNHVTVRSADGQEKSVVDRSYPKSWSADAAVPAGSMILLNVAGEPDRVAPMWMTQVSLGVAILSLGLSGYLVLKLRRATPPRNPAT